MEIGYTRLVAVKPELSVIIPAAPFEREAAAHFERELAHWQSMQVFVTEDLPGAIAQAEADITLIQEPDRRYTLDALTGLLAPIQQDRADVVIGRRESRGLREKALGKFAAWVSDARLSDPLSGQRAFRTKVLKEVALSSRGPELSAELLVKVAAQKYRIVEVPILGGPRQNAPAMARQAKQLVELAVQRQLKR